MEVQEMEITAEGLAEAVNEPRRTVLNWMAKPPEKGGIPSYVPYNNRRYGRRTTVGAALEFLRKAGDNGFREKLLRDWLVEKGMMPPAQAKVDDSSGTNRTDVLELEKV